MAKFIHFHHSFFSTDIKRFWFSGSFWWKYQDYSLTFWPKASIFITLFSQLTKIDFDFGAIFDENTKTIALLYGQKSSICINLSSQLQRRYFDFRAIFDENTKTIALLFGQKSSIFITLSSQLTKIDFDFGAIFDENTKTIALLFGQIHPFSSLFLRNCKREILILGQFLMKIPRL